MTSKQKTDSSPVQVHIRLKKTSEDERGGTFDVLADDRYRTPFQFGPTFNFCTGVDEFS